jgi:voltage-gated potassium channel
MARLIRAMQLPDRTWLRAIVTTAIIVALVAVSTTDPFGIVGATVMLGTLAAAGFFLWLYRGSRFFIVSFANAIAVYACFYTFIVQSNFTDAGPIVVAASFLLPVFSFIASVWWRREAIRSVVDTAPTVRVRRIGRGATWLIPLAIAAATSFLVPVAEPSPGEADLALFVAMSLVSLFIASASHDICVFLIDTGILFDQLFERLVQLAAPAFAFLTLYSLTVIVFAAIYRIVERFSAAPHFVIDGQLADLSFNQSLYFSLVTISTVGYGDIYPHTDVIRLIASIEIVTGVLLLVFGLYEIMNFARAIEEREARREHGHGSD